MLYFTDQGGFCFVLLSFVFVLCLLARVSAWSCVVRRITCSARAAFFWPCRYTRLASALQKLFVCLFVRLLVCAYVCLFIILFVYISVCVSVFVACALLLVFVSFLVLCSCSPVSELVFAYFFVSTSPTLLIRFCESLFV